jgi:hypothetical protein
MSWAAHAEVLEPARRRVANYAGVLLAIAGFVSSLPLELPDFSTLAGLAAVATLFGAALRYCIVSRQPLLGTLAVLYLGAYMPGMGQALLQGITPRSPDLPVSGDAVFTAVLMLLAFVASIILSAVVFRRGWARLAPPVGPANPAWERSVGIGLTICLLVTMVEAFRAGSWTAYGAEATDDTLRSSIKLEYLYEPLLVSWFMVYGRRLFGEYHRPSGERRTALLSALLAAVFFLIFIKQVRRLMITALVLLLLELLDFPGIARRVLRSPTRMLALATLVGAVMLGVFWGSEAWRRSAIELSTNSLAERLDDIATRGNDARAVDQGSVNNVRNRLTYLWFDAATIQYDHVVGGALSLPELFVRTSILVTPNIVFRAKHLYPMQTCETAFTRLGIYTDLPCTSQAEGYIAAGWAGLVGVGILFGLLLSLAALLFQRGRTLSLIAAVHLLLPLGTLEQGAFPTILALRSMTLGTVPVAIVALVIAILFAGRLRVVSENTRTAQQRRAIRPPARAAGRAGTP